MPSIAKPSKKADIKSKKLSSKGKAPAISVEPPQPVAEDSDEQSGDDDSGVDEEGMKKLMKALGDDGLDDYEQAQLIALMGDEEEEEVDEEDGSESDDGEGDQSRDTEAGIEEGSSDGSEDEEDDLDDAEEEEVALDGVESVDEDAVPRQKIEIDNKVSSSTAFHKQGLTCIGIDCSRANS